MEFLSEIFGFGASVASGGLFGLIGSGIGAIGKYFHAKQAFSQEKERRKWDQEDFKLQMQFSAQETEQEIAIASAEGAWNGLSESIKADSKIKDVSPWANNVKTLFRPFLTTALVCVSAWIVWELFESLRNQDATVLAVISEADVKDLLRYSIYSLIFATSTAIVWWFGDRAFAPPGMKNR